MLDSTQQQAVSATLRAHMAAVAALLFGSYAKGHARADSDVDIAVLLAGPEPGPLARLQLQQELADYLHRSVDLIVLNSTSPVLAMQVLAYHRVIFCDDAVALASFQATTVTAYADLKRARAPVEQALLARHA